MTTTTITPHEAITQVMSSLEGQPACIAGSAVAAEIYGLPFAETSDVDVFCYSEQSMISTVQRLISNGYTFDDRYIRVWDRWLLFGTMSWHTNSVKLNAPLGHEVNVVHKLTGKQSLRSLSAVLESFDFGLLGAGYDLVTGKLHDQRSFLFPDYDLDGPLPLMPNKRMDWRNGFISQYNGVREVGRYAKYVQYGHDLSLVKDDLVTGYWSAAAYLKDRAGRAITGQDQDKALLAAIYETIARMIEADQIDECAEAGKKILVLDQLDQIMEALE